MKSIVPLIFFLASGFANIIPTRHSIVYNPELFQSVIKGNQHVVIALGNQAGDRLYAIERERGEAEVQLHKPEKQNEPDPNEVWLLEPCLYCPPNIYRIKHLQSDKYLAISPELFEKYYHYLTLFECKKNYTQYESSLMPYTLDDLKTYWEISPMGSYIRNVYYNEYLIPEKSLMQNNAQGPSGASNDANDNTKAPKDKGDKKQQHEPHGDKSQHLFAGSKLDRDTYWLTFPKAALLYTPPPIPIHPNPAVQPNPAYPGAQPNPAYPGAQPNPAAQPIPGLPPQPHYPGNHQYPVLPQPQPPYPGVQPRPPYPVVQPQPYPGAQYPNAQPLPYPGNQPHPQYQRPQAHQQHGKKH